MYVTERAVFELTTNGLRVVEVMPGFDLQRDVLDQMEFQPLT
jgi:propionate CoA-transferase